MKKFFLFAFAVVLLAACNPSEQLTALTGISINKKSIEVEVGDEYKLRVIYEPSDAQDSAPEVEWESSKPQVATVDNKGVVKGKTVGKTTITAICGKFTAECEVEVVPETPPVPVERIDLNETTLEMKEGQYYTLSVIYTPEESKRKAPEIEWSSSDETVAEVNNGVVKAVGGGNAVITAKCGTHTATCAVTVIAVKVTLDPSSLTFSVEGGEQKVQLKSNTAWTATYSESWITVSPESGEGDAEITVTVTEGDYNGRQDNMAEISFRNEDATTTLPIVRRAPHKGFSVSPTKIVLIAPGDLQYQPSTKTWRFAEHQMDLVGIEGNNMIADPSYTGWIDLFGWGTGDNPTLTSTDANDYSTFVDWGKNKISNSPEAAGVWYTPTIDEWEYMLKTRPNAANKVSLALVNDQRVMVILPDVFKMPAGLPDFTPSYYYFGTTPNKYTTAQWQQMEQAGAALIPASGSRYQTTVTESTYSFYVSWWTSTPNDSNTRNAFYVGAGEGYLYNRNEGGGRAYGNQVRLVKDL